MYDSLPEAAQFTELLLTPPTVVDPITPEPLRAQASDVQFEHVTFAHAGGPPLFTGLDLTVPAGTIAFAELTARQGLVHVIGTTGLTSEDDKLIAEAGKRAVIVKSGNMSLGVNRLAALVKRVAKTLDQDFDIEIIEMHHGRKIDVSFT